MRIFILGDSTASIKELIKRPETGWGEKIQYFLKENIELINLALNGKSTRTFIEEGYFKNAIEKINESDYVILQFGHNDEKKNYRYASPFTDYHYNYNFMINAIKEKKAFPIIFSSISRRKFIGKHRVSRYAIGLYPSMAKLIAKRNNIPFIDMFNYSKDLYEYLDIDHSKKLFLQLEKNAHPNYPDGILDNTHLNDYGAFVIASLVASKLIRLKNELISDYIEPNKILKRVEVKRVLHDNKKIWFN